MSVELDCVVWENGEGGIRGTAPDAVVGGGPVCEGPSSIPLAMSDLSKVTYLSPPKRNLWDDGAIDVIWMIVVDADNGWYKCSIDRSVTT